MINLFTNSEEIDPFSQRMAESLLGNVRDAYLRINEKLRGILGAEHSVDEMALLYTSFPALFRDLTAIVRQEGYSVFNAAQDKVNTRPLRSHYHVNYWFISTPFPYRLELMRVMDGFSPLHANAVAPISRYSDECTWGVHASFKCANEEQYANAHVALLRNGFDLAQSCESTYGRFSYYVNAEEPGETWYVKPRLNIRDAS